MTLRKLTLALAPLALDALRLTELKPNASEPWSMAPLREAVQADVSKIFADVNKTANPEQAFHRDKDGKIILHPKLLEVMEGWDEQIKNIKAEIEYKTKYIADRKDKAFLEAHPQEQVTERQMLEMEDELTGIEERKKMYEFGKYHMKETGEDIINVFHEEELAMNRVDVNWAVWDVEKGSKVFFYMKDDCNDNGKPLGFCKLPAWGGLATPTIIVKMKKKADKNTLIKFNATGAVLNKTYTMQSECYACGKACTVKLPLGSSFEMQMPACPLPAGGLVFTSTNIDFSGVPSWVQGSFNVSAEILRGGSDTKPVARAWMKYEI